MTSMAPDIQNNNIYVNRDMQPYPLIRTSTFPYRLGILLNLFICACVQIAIMPKTMAQHIMLQPAQMITAQSAPLDPGAHAIPCMADWNDDGLPDLIVGYKTDDKIALYLNTGTRSQAQFSEPINIQADGADIKHSSGGCGAPAPWVCDYDADGKIDLLVGTGAEGHIYFYRNLSLDSTPVLAPGVTLKLGQSILDIGVRATPYVHDWNEDGLNDLLCGDGDGRAHYFENIGSAQVPLYDEDVLIQVNGEEVRFGNRSAIRVYDWDHDGLKDLLGSASNNVSWLKNIGDNSHPSFASMQPLQAPLQGQGLANIDTGYRMRLEIADFNNDNLMDLLIGDDEGYIFYYEAYEFKINSITLSAPAQVILTWNSAPYLEYDALVNNVSNENGNPSASKLPSGGKSTSWTYDVQEDTAFFRMMIAQ
jgi:hypothetical protein